MKEYLLKVDKIYVSMVSNLKVTVISLIISLFFIMSLIWADSNGIWHNPSDIRVGTFGSDEINYGDDFTYYIFNNRVRFNKFSQFDSDIQVNGEIKTDVIKSNTGGSVTIKLG